MRNLALPLVVLFIPGCLNAQRELDLSQYKIIWQDNFDYTSIDNMFDPSPANNFSPKWKNGTSYGCEWCPTDDGNGNRLYWKADRGELFIEAQPSNNLLHMRMGHSIDPYAFNCAGESGYMNHTCASIASSYDNDYYDCTGFGNIGFQYGVFEIRAKIPGGYVDQSAFWLWGGYYQCGSTNGCTGPGYEIDFFETRRNDITGELDYWTSVQRNAAPGIYLIKIVAGRRQFIKKIIVQ